MNFQNIVANMEDDQIMGDFPFLWATPSREWATFRFHGRLRAEGGRFLQRCRNSYTMDLPISVNRLIPRQPNKRDLSDAFLLPHHPSRLAL